MHHILAKIARAFRHSDDDTVPPLPQQVPCEGSLRDESNLITSDGVLVTEVMLQIAAARAYREWLVLTRDGHPVPPIETLLDQELTALHRIVNAMFACRARRIEIEQMTPEQQLAAQLELHDYIRKNGMGGGRLQ